MNSVRNRVYVRVRERVWDRVNDRVYVRVRARVWDRVWNRVEGALPRFRVYQEIADE